MQNSDWKIVLKIEENAGIQELKKIACATCTTTQFKRSKNRNRKSKDRKGAYRINEPDESAAERQLYALNHLMSKEQLSYRECSPTEQLRILCRIVNHEFSIKFNANSNWKILLKIVENAVNQEPKKIARGTKTTTHS